MCDDLLDRRRAGVLLHPTSLPGPLLHGDLGEHAHHFLDFLVDSGMSVWQMLPVGPTGQGDSPYQCLSAHAGNPDLIDLQWLVERDWLQRDEFEELIGLGDDVGRKRCLRQAGDRFFRAGGEARRSFDAFVAAHADWLEDYALFVALKDHYDGLPWFEWPAPERLRDARALQAARQRLATPIGQVCFEQYVFDCQWQALRDGAHERGIRLFGDLPIFVSRDSAEVWSEPGYFKLDAEGQCEVVAGVPPDYFSETGQRWGNPVYCWSAIEKDGFRWWIRRMATELARFDLVRIDHFRGLESYWEIPAADEDARGGQWVKAPGRALLETLGSAFDCLPLVAEDLGVITPEVEALRDDFDLPGMRILQFAFDSDAANPYLPHNHEANAVVYTGTHDNDTSRSWFDRLEGEQARRVHEYLGHPGEVMPWPLIRSAIASVGRLAMVPMQDVLMLGTDARMNTPGTTEGNWRWRFQWEDVDPALAAHLREMNGLYGRE